MKGGMGGIPRFATISIIMDPVPEPTSLVLDIVILVVLIICSALFSSAETAFTSLDFITIKEYANEEGRKGKRARKVEKILQSKDEMLSAILIGNNVVNLFASSLTTTVALDVFGSKSVGIATGILTFVILEFGEIVPKSIAGRYADKIALVYSNTLYNFMILIKPIIFIINIFSHILMRIVGIKPTDGAKAITEERLKTMLDMSLEAGQIEEEEHELTNNALELDESNAKDIMVPRSNIIGINVDNTYEEIVEIFKTERYSRLVVFDSENIEVAGIIHIKDFLFIKKEEFDMQKILRPAYFAYETVKVSELLKELKKINNNMAIILDEYGDVSGLITIEDIIEEIIGEVRDEYDAEELNQIKKLDENVYEVEGSMNLDDINDFLNIELESEEYQSIGGFIIERLETFPKEGDKIEDGDVSAEIIEMDDNRISKIKLSIAV